MIRLFRLPDYSCVVAFAIQMWAVIAVCFCFAMVAGHMWNKMIEPQFCHRTDNGPVYINGNFDEQFVAESYIVAILNGAVVIGMILMIEAAGGVKGINIHRAQERKRRRFQSAVGLLLVCVFFSLLLSVFRAKTYGYPYRFLFK